MFKIPYDITKVAMSPTNASRRPVNSIHVVLPVEDTYIFLVIAKRALRVTVLCCLFQRRHVSVSYGYVV